MSKSIEEQMEAVKNIMGNTKKSDEASYCLKGKTFMLKEDLKSWGWSWNPENKYWELLDVMADDASLRIVEGIPDTWVEEITV